MTVGRTVRVHVRRPVPDAGTPIHRPAGATPARGSGRSATRPSTPDTSPGRAPTPDDAERRPSTPDTRGAPARWRGLRPVGGHRVRLTAAVLVVLLAGALAGVGVVGRRWYDADRLEAAHQGALAAARQVTADFVSVSAASIDRDLQRISAGATGQFKDELTRGQPQVRAAVVENNVEAHGTVLRAGLVSGDLDSAVVLVAVDATVKNVRAPEGRLSHYRIQVELARDRHTGRWLVSRLEFVG